MTKDKAPEEVVEHTEAHIHSKDGQLVRSYTKEVHGETFAELADEFAKARGHEVRVR